MPATPQAAPLPDDPQYHLKGECLAIASPDSLAEASFSVPAVRAIRTIFPQGTIAVIANHETAPLWRKVTEVSQVIEHSSSDSHRKISRLLKASGLTIDSSIAWEDSAAAQSFAKLEVEKRFGYPAERLAQHLTDPVQVVRKIGPIEHRVEHYLLFVEKLGAAPFHPSNFTTPQRPSQPQRPVLAIAPGSDFGTAAEWPLKRFADLAERMDNDFDIAILSNPERRGPASALAKALGKKVTQLEGEELIDFLSQCHGLIASDSSTPHLAAFVGTPALIFFGPNEPDWRRPLGRIHKILRRHVPCSGCLLNKCPLDHRCMEEITPEEASAGAQALFSKHSTSPS